MASFREYCEILSTEQLKALLREECQGNGTLPVGGILDICDTLSQREPDKPGVKEMLRRLCECYI